MSQQESYEKRDNEIDLKELMRSIIDTRSWVLVTLIIISIAYWAAAVVINYAKPTVQSYEQRIDLIFKGVDKGEYPNESPFSVSHIVAPVVLNRVYDKNNLSGLISRRDFISGFTATPYTPERELIIAKYSDQLKSKALTGIEIEGLQKQLKDELTKAAAEGASIIFSSSQASSIPTSLMRKIMADVAAEWERHMTEGVGVTEFDVDMYSEDVMDLSLIESIDYLIAFELLLDRLNLLEANVAHLREMPNGLVVEDDESGLSVPDLGKAILDVKRYRVAPLVNPVRSLGIAKNPELVALYFENELLILRRNKENLMQKKQNIEDAYSSYMRYQAGRSQANATASNASSMIPQVGAEFLDRIIEMTSAGTDIEYRQDLNVRLLEISNEYSDTSMEIVRIEEILKSMSGADNSAQSLRERYTEQVVENLPGLIDQLKSFFRISNRIYEKLSREELGGVGSMYRPADGDLTYNESRNIFSADNFKTYFIFCFLAIIVAVPLLMVRNALRAK